MCFFEITFFPFSSLKILFDHRVHLKNTFLAPKFGSPKHPNKYLANFQSLDNFGVFQKK